jgi:hypothetical protein
VYFEDHAATDIMVPFGDEPDQTAPIADIDSDGDGADDTVVVVDPAGGAVLFTDVDGDGSADVTTEITSEGQVTVAEHVGDGQWAVVERSRLGAGRATEPPVGGRADDASLGFASSGADSAGSGAAGSVASDSGAAGSVLSIDPVTGEWMSA